MAVKKALNGLVDQKTLQITLPSVCPPGAPQPCVPMVAAVAFWTAPPTVSAKASPAPKVPAISDARFPVPAATAPPSPAKFRPALVAAI